MDRLCRQLLQLVVLGRDLPNRRASLTPIPPNRTFELYNVAGEIAWRRHNSAVTAPAPASFKTPMICTLVNLPLRRLPSCFPPENSGIGGPVFGEQVMSNTVVGP